MEMNDGTMLRYVSPSVKVTVFTSNDVVRMSYVAKDGSIGVQWDWNEGNLKSE